jgi:hypothetical protein
MFNVKKSKKRFQAHRSGYCPSVQAQQLMGGTFKQKKMRSFVSFPPKLQK